jgi:indole-3-glycerol phosphate synthase
MHEELSGLAGEAAHAARRVVRLKREEPIEALRARPMYARQARDLAPALIAGALIVEIRFADMEGGLIVPRESATPEEAARRASAAARSGAAAVAIWVERNFHAGDYTHLDAARTAEPELLLIARDLITDPWQIERCRAGGADAVELIPELLGSALVATAAAVRALGMEAVVFDRALTLRLA